MLGLAVALGVADCAFIGVVLAAFGPDRAAAWATVAGVPAGVVAAVAAVWAVVPRRVPLPPELLLEDWVIDRPAELGQVVAALTSGRRAGGMIAITTALTGAGGFGKTTLAKMACADRRVRRYFGGRVYPVTIGRDVRGAAAIAAKVNDVIKLVGGVDATFTDPEQAGQRLGSLLNEGPRRLLVLDDVWEREQLDPFTDGGTRCARLVTTRTPALLAGRGVAVRVDQMSPAQARRLLTGGLPPLDPAVTDGLLGATGSWPLLLRLVNKIMVNAAQAEGAAGVSAAGALLLDRLRAEGPAAADRLLGVPGRLVDVGNPRDRERAVLATVDASRQLLDPADAQRLAELAVFTEDEVIPAEMVAMLWGATAGLDRLQAAQVCARLAELALVTIHRHGGEGAGGGGATVMEDGAGVALHDVVRDFLRAELGAERLAALHRVLLDAAAAGLPAASPLADPDSSHRVVAWWELSAGGRYLRDHLIWHLLEAGRAAAAEELACDLRWAGTRLVEAGPAAVAAGLSTAATPRAARLRVVVTQVEHLLAPCQPSSAVVDVLHSRVAADPDWGPQVTALREICRRPRLVNRWPLPDLPHPALRISLEGDQGPVLGLCPVRVAGQDLLASVGDDEVRIWDPATRRQRNVLEGHQDRALRACTVTVAGQDLLATANGDGTVRIWDPATGRQRTILKGHQGSVWAVCPVAVDGHNLLASGGKDRTVRIWDPATGRQLTVLKGHQDEVWSVCPVRVDGQDLLASGGDDRTVRIWDPATGRQRTVLEGHSGHVHSVCPVRVAGQDLLASASASARDDEVRIWDPAIGRQRTVLEGYSACVCPVRVNGQDLLASAGHGTVRIWDPATGQQRVAFEDRRSSIFAICAVRVAGQEMLASAGHDGTVRIWDLATRQQRNTQEGRQELEGRQEEVYTVCPVTVAGQNLLASAGHVTVRIWDPATGQQHAILEGHENLIRSLCTVTVARQDLLASGGDDGMVLLWDPATWQKRDVLERRQSQVFAVCPVRVAGQEMLASAGRDDTVRIWDLATGRQQVVLHHASGPVALGQGRLPGLRQGPPATVRRLRGRLRAHPRGRAARSRPL